jgi:hypothetical protein
MLGSCEHGNKTSTSIKCCKIVEQIRGCWRPKEDSDPLT